MEPKDYIVEKIDGDYAHLKNLDDGEVTLVARALLPEEIDEETLIHWEDLTYTIV
ncbi:MAG: chorismate--pyruvate lyase [Ruminococcus sp.]|nr:chorismate--pyruvate lyase [Ruminococcus sp.]